MPRLLKKVDEPALPSQSASSWDEQIESGGSFKPTVGLLQTEGNLSLVAVLNQYRYMLAIVRQTPITTIDRYLPPYLPTEVPVQYLASLASLAFPALDRRLGHRLCCIFTGLGDWTSQLSVSPPLRSSSLGLALSRRSLYSTE